jgi:hypothetical protein
MTVSLDDKIEVLELPTRIESALLGLTFQSGTMSTKYSPKKAPRPPCATVGQLVSRSRTELVKMRGIGIIGVRRIEQALAEHHLRLKPDGVLRRGLLSDLTEVFDHAIDMCGSFPPDMIHLEQERFRQLHRELFELLAGLRANLSRRGRS